MCWPAIGTVPTVAVEGECTFSPASESGSHAHPEKFTYAIELELMRTCYCRGGKGAYRKRPFYMRRP